MEWLNSVWGWVLTLLGSATFVSTLTALAVGASKGLVSRKIKSFNIEKKSQEVVDAGLEKIKTVTFKHNIEPLVESHLRKVNEYSVDVLRQELGEVKAEYCKIVSILEKFSAYFDDSVVVTDSKKQELKNAIENAKIDLVSQEDVETDKVIIEEVKVAEKAKKETLSR